MAVRVTQAQGVLLDNMNRGLMVKDWRLVRSDGVKIERVKFRMIRSMEEKGLLTPIRYEESGYSHLDYVLSELGKQIAEKRSNALEA